ncbi:MAG: sensor histidine kinase [Bacillota bacterium]
MGIYGFQQNKSIRSRIMHIFVLITIIMTIAFYISFSMKNVITKEYDKSMHNNILLSKLSIEIDKSGKSFDKYMRSRDLEFLRDYYQSTNSVDAILVEIKKDIQKDKNSSIYYRNLSNMVDYQKRLVSEMLMKEKMDTEVYNKWTNLKTLYTYMNTHSQMLTTYYLDYSSSQYSNLLAKYKGIEINIFAIIVIFGCASFLFARALSDDILYTIDGLSKSAQLLSEAHWEIPDINESRYKELSAVANAFNDMKNNIKRFIEELNQKSEMESHFHKERLKNIEKDKLLKESQLMALQMQMDPHFLFNTLNTVARTAMFEDADNTVRLIEAISKILRYNLSCHGKLVTLKEEIGVLKAYIYIQETRFQDQMSFDWDIKGDIEHVLIPPMTLQPIVENSIIHGLQDKEKDGRVSISITRDEHFLNIQIRDNGKGIGDKELKNLFHDDGERQKRGHTTGLGLANVKERLEIYFGEENLISVDSVVGEGTTVYLQIPLKGDEEVA